MIATADGYLAVGDDGFPGASVQLPGLRQAAIWHGSSDGREWVRLPAPTDAAQRELLGLVGGPSGYVAWGGGAPPGSGAVWTSADGRSWQPVAAPAGGWGPIGRVIASRAGYVAVGSAVAGGSSVPGIWTSPDGSAWTARPPGGSGASLWDVAALGDVVVAVGDGVTAESDDDGVTWTVASPDSSLAGGTARHLVSSLGGDLVAFGTIPGATADQGQIWFARSGVPAVIAIDPKVMNGTTHACSSDCVLVATIGAGYAFATKPLAFAP